MEEREIIICECHSTEHQYIFLYDEDKDKDRTVYLEYSNEVWNKGFFQGKYAAKKGSELAASLNKDRLKFFCFSQRVSNSCSIMARSA